MHFKDASLVFRVLCPRGSSTHEQLSWKHVFLSAITQISNVVLRRYESSILQGEYLRQLSAENTKRQKRKHL